VLEVGMLVSFQESGFIWEFADDLRFIYKMNEYQKVILPVTARNRFDCVFYGDFSVV
jgi:type I restriction-modification system DNA methylase subunit